MGSVGGGPAPTTPQLGTAHTLSPFHASPDDRSSRRHAPAPAAGNVLHILAPGPCARWRAGRVALADLAAARGSGHQDPDHHHYAWIHGRQSTCASFLCACCVCVVMSLPVP
jgi:hypothetical protein